ncbi:hypothetical protein BHE74_00038886 [Ensete ventricosum]|nr:hypothetical protein GW17_00025246 [Ensete ventricosum]RWW54542.1 hypothetical protein BHE74_00038886 [Ensete ventricosum]
MKRTASAIFPSSVVTSVEPLLLFKDVPNAEKQNLFISKLNYCCRIFDFSDPNKNSAEKDMKRQVLLDLIGYVDAGTSRFTEPVISASCKMIAINLFRAFPPNTRFSTGGGETEEEVPVAERALFLWNNDHVINLTSQNLQVIMPLVLPALERNLRSHWNQAVLNLTQNVKKMFSEMDEELVLACKKKFEDEEKKQKTMEEKRRMIWAHMETNAAFHPVTGNTAVLVVPVIAPLIAAALT